MLRCLLLSAVVTAFTAQMGAQDRSLPLFLIARSTNANVIHYEVQVTRDGRLDLRQPVIAYWVMAAEDGKPSTFSYFTYKVL